MAGSSGSGRLEDASYLQLRPSQAKAPLKSSAPKTLSSLTPCSCFCYRALFLQLFVLVVALLCHIVFVVVRLEYCSARATF
jgi:hypothetical protein